MMAICCCSLAGTSTCQHCQNNPMATDVWTNKTVTVNHVEAKPFSNGIEVAPVRHGKWEDIHRQGLDGVFHYYRSCSLCGYERKDCDSNEDTPYCPNCGAEMEKGE